MTETFSDTHHCPFCGNNFAAKAFMSNNHFLAVYNIAPVLPGHTLVVPRCHATSLNDLSEEEISGLFLFARQVTTLLTKAFGGSGFDWSIQDGKPAGQTVPHLHLHIVVRKENDLNTPGDWYPLVEKVNNTLLESFDRRQLTDAEYNRITDYLRSLNDSQSKKE
jgi:bis(5'-adenosyl)-triphosphatase